MWLVGVLVVFTLLYLLLGLISPRYNDEEYHSQLEDSDESKH